MRRKFENEEKTMKMREKSEDDLKILRRWPGVTEGKKGYDRSGGGMEEEGERDEQMGSNVLVAYYLLTPQK